MSSIARDNQAGRSPSNSKASRRSSFIDPTTLMRINDLQLRSKVVVEGFLSGLHRSPVHGFSVEFTEYRQYTPGDDLRFLDWRLYARSDRFYLKRFEDETNLRSYLLVDLSRSMGFKSLEYDKAQYAKTVAGTLAYFMTLQRDAVGLITFDQSIREFMPARFRAGHLHRLLLSLDRSTGGQATDLVTPLEQIANTARKRGLVVLISDLLAPVESLEKRFGYLRSRGHDVLVIRVLDPAEVDFSFPSEAMFRDMETGRELYIDPAAAKQQYQRRYAEHARELIRVFNQLGIDYYDLVTNQPLDLALFDLLNARMRRGRFVARRAGLTRSVRSS